jgi:transcriptional regulator with XRE-family HTH domain
VGFYQAIAIIRALPSTAPFLKLRRMISPSQCRMARAALSWTTHDLAARARVSANTVSKFESNKVKPNPSTVAVIQRALEEAGIIFIDNGEGQGVKLKRET